MYIYAHTLAHHTNVNPCFVCYSLKIFSLQAEALLKVHRHQEADEALSRGPNFGVDACTKYFGPISNASMLVTRAQVDMCAGRYISCFMLVILVIVHY